MGNNDVIELNGKRYDAITGKYLGVSHAKPVPAAPSPIQPRRRTIDGVTRPTATKTATKKPASAPHTAQPAKKHKKPARHHAPHHTQPHHPQRPQTLMRHAVKKPQATPKPAIKLQTPAEIAAAPASSLAPKRSVAQVDPMRLHRAHHTQQHTSVQRFARQAVRATQPERVAPRATTASAHGPILSRPSATPTKQQPVDIFEAALARATSHEQPTPKIVRHRNRRKRTMQVIAGVVVVLIIGGFVAWMQRPHIELRLASFQAGFRASMPSRQLTGYSRGTIRQDRGQVVMSYHSGDAHYRITQQSSSWNSQTLLDSAVAGATTEEPHIIESKGRIVYIYGNNASWVDGGVRYDIAGNAPLTTADIQAIVDSM